MGKRSQIYIRMDAPKGKLLLARYYGWVYGERMVSRARATIEWAKEYMDNNQGRLLPGYSERLVRIMDTNFDMRDVQIGADLIQERAEEFPEAPFAAYVFYHGNNNDGKLFIDIDCENNVVKYAFVDEECDLRKIMDAVAYMDWDYTSIDWRKELPDGVVATVGLNAEYIHRNAVLMTRDELAEFISYNYEGEQGNE